MSLANFFLESSGGVVVRALASYQCGPGSIPRLGVICGLSLLVLYSAVRGFPGVLQFSPLLKNQHLMLFDLSYFQFTECPSSASVLEDLTLK